MAASNDPAQTSPKVKAVDKWGTIGTGVGAIALVFVGLLATQITPELLDFLGPWAVPVSFAIGGTVATVTARKGAWNALDPLRQDYAEQAHAHEEAAKATTAEPVEVYDSGQVESAVVYNPPSNLKG